MHLPVYMDYAATTPVHSEVMNAMVPYFSGFFGNPASRYHAYGWMAEEAIDSASALISKNLGCGKNEIIYTSGATESINMALNGVMESDQDLQLITFETEHKATLETAKYWESKNRSVCILKVDQNGQLDLNVLSEVLKNKKSLVSAIWINNETGVIFPVDDLVELKKKHDFLLHIDATQAIGKLEFSFNSIGFDLMSFSAHKIYGPKGVGALIVKKDVVFSPLIRGGGQQRGLRGGTVNVPGIIGLSKALELVIDRTEAYVSKTLKIKTELERQLIERFDFLKINGSSSKRTCNISNVCFTGHDGEDLLMRLSQVAVSNGSACNSASTSPSHVLKAMGLSDQHAFASLRFSLGYENKMEDINVLMENLEEILK